MRIFRHRRRANRVLALDILAVALVAAGLVGLAFGRSGGAPPVKESGTVPRSGSPIHSTAPVQRKARHQSLEKAPVRAPSHLAIPAAGISTEIVRLGLNPDGTLEVPSDFGVAGWYELGPKPGETGAAVIVGHVDSKEGPGVFYRLGEVAPGDLVSVASPNRPGIPFRVYAVREYSKAAFPTSLVYRQTARPELRLITCGGTFDEATGHYLDNVVVFARQVEEAVNRIPRRRPRGLSSGSLLR